MSALLSLLLLAAGLPVVDLEGWPSLSPDGQSGDVVLVVGRVFDEAGRPVADASVFAYHADAAGKYHDDAFRGTVRTDDAGRYRFYTVRPGGYGPPPHIHFRVTAGDRPELRPTLHFPRPPSPPRRVRAGRQEAEEYTFDMAWGS